MLKEHVLVKFRVDISRLLFQHTFHLILGTSPCSYGFKEIATCQFSHQTARLCLCRTANVLRQYKHHYDLCSIVSAFSSA